jgi:2'-5' RNA ligase
VRLFLAAALPEVLRFTIADVLRDLKKASLPVRWARPEGMHLTFVFLGEVKSATEAALLEAIAPRVAPLPAFRLEARGLGAFPEHGRPRIVWAGVEGDLAAAARLKTALDEAVAPLGFTPEARPFRPHLTLGRVGSRPMRRDWRSALGPLAAESFGDIPVDDVRLIESQLLPDGARYQERAVFPLARAGAGA